MHPVTAQALAADHIRDLHARAAAVQRVPRAPRAGRLRRVLPGPSSMPGPRLLSRLRVVGRPRPA